MFRRASDARPLACPLGIRTWPNRDLAPRRDNASVGLSYNSGDINRLRLLVTSSSH